MNSKSITITGDGDKYLFVVPQSSYNNAVHTKPPITRLAYGECFSGGSVTATVRHSKASHLDTYSIQLRLQRTTTEHCFVSVPVTSDIVDPQDDGTGRINAEKMTALAIEIASAPDAQWHKEEAVIQPHPIQRPKEADE